MSPGALPPLPPRDRTRNAPAPRAAPAAVPVSASAPSGRSAIGIAFDLCWAVLFLLVALAPGLLPSALAGLATETAVACLAMVLGLPLLRWLVIPRTAGVGSARVRIVAVVLLLAAIAPLMLLFRNPDRTPLELLLPAVLVLTALPSALRVASDRSGLRNRAIAAGLGVLALTLLLPALVRAGLEPARAYVALAGGTQLALACVALLRGGTARA